MNELKDIPHLRLGEVDVHSLIHPEVEALREHMVGYELPGADRSEAEKEQYRRSWKGVGLIDYDEDASKGMLDARSYKGQPSPFDIKYDGDGRPIMKETWACELAPNVVNFIYSLFMRPNRCRVTAITPGNHLHWHSHCQFKSGNYDQHAEYNIAIVHIALKTNPAVKFGVTKFHHSEHGVNPFWQHYAVGEVWLLNAWHEHNVFNGGDEDRLHLMMYGRLDDSVLRKEWIEPALENYDGPLIE